MRALDSIVIGERVRKDMGDIASLAESMRRHGLLHPVVIKTDGALVAGQRRIEAARSIGWTEIPVTVIDVADLLSAERDENGERKDFTPTEAVAIGRLIEEQEKPDARKRAMANLRQNRDRAVESEPRGEIAEAIAKAVGMGRSKYTQAKEVVAAAEADPSVFGDLSARMDDTGNVSGAHREMKRRKGNGKARHPVHNRSPYPKPNREMERSIFSLDGICACLQAIPLSDLDASKVRAWSKSLKKSSAIISKIARRIANVKVQ